MDPLSLQTIPPDQTDCQPTCMQVPRCCGVSPDPRPAGVHMNPTLAETWEGTETLQYEMIEALLGLRSQGVRDGWGNWNEFSVEQLNLLRARLPGGGEKMRILSDLDKVQAYGEGDGVVGYEEIDRLAGDLVRWCCARPVWIRLPEGCRFWLDVSGDAVPPAEGRDEPLISRLREKILALFGKSAKVEQ